jgi:hypothetical protein
MQKQAQREMQVALQTFGECPVLVIAVHLKQLVPDSAEHALQRGLQRLRF